MLFFDLDGTITDTNMLWLDVDKDFLGRRGLPYTSEYQQKIAHCIFNTAATYTKELFSLPESEEEIKAEWMELAHKHYKTAALKPHAEEYLRLLHGKGHRLGIITACMPELLETVLKNRGIYDLFEIIVYTNELGYEKRRPEPYLFAAEKAGVEIFDCVMFEDSPVAAAGAVEAGMKVVGVYDGYYAPRRAEMESICHKYIESFSELM
ncbi:MAG: HAD family phosphatase [Oscillospiraceae bacterium]|nr:HAD family phosphatase [Oscillospiraceae bacterium]